MEYILPLSKCEWDKKNKKLLCASEYFGMPSTFFVVSEKTGVKIQFVPLVRGDEGFDEDFWDGEQMIYKPVENIQTVNHFVIYHQY